jgi:CHAT domain-containing protein
VLSLVNTGQEDGILRASEIFNLDLNADLVTLSACRTGLGKVVRGEGMIGLTRAILYAGASSVLVSLWEVNDLAAPVLMKSFYTNLRNGQSVAEALREAKITMIHSTGRHTGIPTYGRRSSSRELSDRPSFTSYFSLISNDLTHQRLWVPDMIEQEIIWSLTGP